MKLIDIEPILRKKLPLLIMLDEILSAPSLDLVRCGECKYWSGCKSTMHNSHLCHRAENIDYWTKANDFCSYGERKE